MQRALAKLRSAHSFRDPMLEELAKYNYTLGTDGLLPYGWTEYVTRSNSKPEAQGNRSRSSGERVYSRYNDLCSAARPFVRSTSSERVVDSTAAWREG